MPLLDSLQSHTAICDEIYRLMLDLNRVLKSGTPSPEAALLDRHRTALATLERSLVEVRSFAGHSTGSPAEVRSAIEKCQRTIMKALLLDRENEQLLLKNAMVRPRVPNAARPTPGHLARTYGKHT